MAAGSSARDRPGRLGAGITHMNREPHDRKPRSGSLSPEALDALLKLGLAAGNKLDVNEPPLRLPNHKAKKTPPR